MLLGALLAALASAPDAPARVLLVGDASAEVALVELSTDRVVAELAMPAAVTAVAVDPTGDRGYAAAGNTVVELDLDARTETRRTVLGGAPISELAAARDGRLLALQGDRVTVIDAGTLQPAFAIALQGVGRRLTAGRRSDEAVVVLAGGRVAILALAERRVSRTARVPGATGATIDRMGRTWVAARGYLRLVPARRSRVSRTTRLRLPRGAGGAIVPSPRDARIAIGAVRGARGAVVDLASRSVRRFASGSRPGAPSWSLDATRLYVPDAASGSVWIVGAAGGRRLRVIDLPGATPVAVVEQPGLARLAGSDAADALTGTGGRDRIEGLAGDDHLRGARGRDIVSGGPGDDRLSGGAASDLLDGGDGQDYLSGGTGDDRIDGGPGADAGDGGTGNDTLDGGGDDDVLDGGDGDDTILGGAGDDRIVERGFGNDKRLSGGPGDDVIEGGRGSDRVIEGEDGNDRLSGGPGKESISGGTGNDVLDGGRARDRMRGDEGDDELRGDAGDDILGGGEDGDRLDGGSGDDELDGGEGSDMLIGGPGPDAIAGGGGDDTIRAADDSADTVGCGPGSDTVYVEADAPQRDRLTDCELVTPIAPESANDTTPPSLFFGLPRPELIRGTPGDDGLHGNAGDDRLFAAAGDDYVDGGKGDDELHGGSGDDIMAGRRGSDRIFGDTGDDHITGDRGDDTIDGGPGADRIFGNLDDDAIAGGAGDDRINVVGGGRDVVRCGPGSDSVFADARDRVTADCERISR
ncbi:MAG TPA: calcium-binding protein [Solirubrobacteraceae bacterium]|nr:calcium-binding protein [Solirubrobacteraceae bacterium]